NSLSDLTAPYITFFFIIIPRPPISTLFPYTTLFRSLFTNAPVHSLGSARAALATEAIVTCGAAFKTSLTVVSFLARRGTGSAERSEEHTSELQSPYDLVCRLLLEKKKKTNTSVGRIS